MQQTINTQELENALNKYGDIVLTKNSKNDVIIMSISEYKRKLKDNELSKKLDKAEQQIKDGKTVKATTVFRELEEKYGLTEALIAVPAYEQSSDQEVAFQAVDYILRVLKKNMVFGMTWGRAMHEFVEQLAKDERLRSLSFQNVKVVPFLGTPGAIQSDSWNTTTYSNTLATKVGNLLHCASYNLSAPMYVEGTKEKELIESIDEIAKVLHMAETADIALIGIGSMQDDSSIIKAEIRTKEEYKELVRKGAVGEIVGRIYDKNGQTVDEDLKRKMVGISLDKIAKIPVRVGMSYGKDKIEAIKGAIAGGLVNVLVTDVPTAELLLK